MKRWPEEEAAPSEVEVLSEHGDKPLEASAPRLPSVDQEQQLDGSPATQVFPDYVTLSRDVHFGWPTENRYIDQCETPAVGGDEPASSEAFDNRCYLLVAQPADSAHDRSAAGDLPGNLYSNLPCS